MIYDFIVTGGGPTGIVSFYHLKKLSYKFGYLFNIKYFCYSLYEKLRLIKSHPFYLAAQTFGYLKGGF